jgi:GH15 family glucan-1,4-alpha-glucosidase
MAGTEGPMKVLSPMSQDDEADREHVKRLVEGEGDSDDEEQDEKESKHWKSKVESTLVKMTAEMAALREQIATGREWRNRRRRTIGAWLGWLLYVAIRQVIVDGFVLALVLLWMRKKKDRRLEDIVREFIRMGRDYIRRYLPSR